MSQSATAFGERFGNENLKAYEVEVGQVYETETGVRVEVVEEERGSKPLVVSKDDRDGEERMSRYSFADMVNYEGMVRVEEADEDDEEEDTLPGEFTDETPRCPVCSRFMSTGYDGMGHPAASCSRPDCPGFLDDRDLIEGGYYEQ